MNKITSELLPILLKKDKHKMLVFHIRFSIKTYILQEIINVNVHIYIF